MPDRNCASSAGVVSAADTARQAQANPSSPTERIAIDFADQRIVLFMPGDNAHGATEVQSLPIRFVDLARAAGHRPALRSAALRGAERPGGLGRFALSTNWIGNVQSNKAYSRRTACRLCLNAMTSFSWAALTSASVSVRSAWR